MKTRTFKRKKSAWKNNAVDAMADVMSKENVTAKELTEGHTETHFVWKTESEKLNFQPETETESETPTTFSIAINEVENENEADHKAIEAMDTFGANLKTDHTKTHYVYSKIR